MVEFVSLILKVAILGFDVFELAVDRRILALQLEIHVHFLHFVIFHFEALVLG